MQQTSFPSNRRAVLQTLGAALALPLAGLARAQATGPAQSTVKITVGFAPGGMTDTIGRRMADKLTGVYGHTVLVDNRTGAGGQIAVQTMKQAPADGTQLVISPAGQLVIFPHAYSNLAYNPLTDLEPVSICTVVESGIAVGPLVPASIKTVPEFFAWCKANPQLANFGSPGAGTISHFVPEIISRGTGAGLRHVPYRGALPAIQDMIGGQLTAVSTAVGDYLPYMAAGKCRVLGTAGPKRNRFMPQVATYTEQGYKDAVVTEWFGVFAPAKTPAAAIARANRDIVTALAAQDFIDSMAKFGLESVSSTPEELKRRLHEDYAYWGRIVKETGFKADA